MTNRFTFIIAGILLTLMFLLTVCSIKNDTLTFDEVSHIPAGYSYLTQKDYRINPEHPPIIKDLAAIPLLFLDLNFPKHDTSWIQEGDPAWWFQFDFGYEFLYNSGNDPDQIMFWARLPMILMLILFAFFIFFWAKKLGGNKAGLLALSLFSFSPTLLAHGRLVTTDVGAAFGATIGTYFWLKFLKEPTKKNIILAGLIFGIAMLFKFSLILLLPFFAILTIVHAILKTKKGNIKKYTSNIFKYFLLSLFAIIIGMVFIVLPVYQYHVLNLSPERQARDIAFHLRDTSYPIVRDSLIWASDKPILRSYSQYFLGINMILQRASHGHTTYFMGEVSASGWKQYFPIIYGIKVPLTFHILTLLALLQAIRMKKKPFWKNTIKRMKKWIASHFTEFSMLLFIAIYWTTSLSTNLNIGVRHLLPVFPFTIILVSLMATKWLEGNYLKKTKHAFIIGLIFLQFTTVIAIFPFFLAYFNELAGGPNNGHLYAVDSNLDWGQDLKRLKQWTDKNNIDTIYVDYFGGGRQEYYLKEKFQQWWGTRSEEAFPKGNYLAVSVSLLQGGQGKPATEFTELTGYYDWLNKHELVAKIGYSIFIFYIE